MSTDLAVIEAALKAAQAEVEGHRGIVIPGVAFQKVAASAPTWLAELVERVKAAEAEVERLLEQNTRYATRLATYRESMQQQLDPMFATLAAMREILAGDWSPEAPGEWELNAERVRVLRELLGVTS